MISKLLRETLMVVEEVVGGGVREREEMRVLSGHSDVWG